MRNLIEYPITADEVRATVQRQLDRIEQDNTSGRMQIGGVDALIWSALLRVLEDPIYHNGTKVVDLIVEAARI